VATAPGKRRLRLAGHAPCPGGCIGASGGLIRPSLEVLRAELQKPASLARCLLRLWTAAALPFPNRSARP